MRQLPFVTVQLLGDYSERARSLEGKYTFLSAILCTTLWVQFWLGFTSIVELTVKAQVTVRLAGVCLGFT